jgi:putative NADH-flavin reductase
MKIALFGASGKTGAEFLQIALAEGHQLRALVRNPEKIKSDHPGLEIVKGDVLDAAAVAETIREADIVVSLFGRVKDSPPWLQTDGTKNIVAAMEKFGVKRVISLSGGGLPFPEKDKPGFMDRVIRLAMRTFAPGLLEDAVAHADVLRQSGLSWVIVRGPRLTSEPARQQYRVGWVGVNGGMSLGRADLAAFVLRLCKDRSFDGQMPFVSY